MGKVKQERSGWRDENISRRHRDYGYDVPCVDMDFILLSYDQGKPVALIEYKHERAEKMDLGHPTLKALSELFTHEGDGIKQLPLFICRYKDDFSEYIVTPVNTSAMDKLKGSHTLSEERFVKFLYWLRSRKVPPDLFPLPTYKSLKK